MNPAASRVLVCALEGETLTNKERHFFAKMLPAGVTLFRRNIPQHLPSTSKLTRELQSLRPAGVPPFLVAIDQEGGRVSRLGTPFPDDGPAMTLADGAVDESALSKIRSYAQIIGKELLNIGVNVNFAPVVDILTEPDNHAIGDRAFGTDVHPVCERAGSFLDGLQQSGVLGCLKHFPGQGDAKVDTHVEEAVVDLPRKMINDRELVPYRQLCPRSAMVMVSHCLYPQLDSEPANRSAKIIGGLLKGELDFRGIVVSDDMTMSAVPQAEDVWKESIVEAIGAGIDMVLVCRGFERYALAIEALDKVAARYRGFRDRLEQAAERVTKMRLRLEE